MYDLISIGNVSIDLYFKGESLTYSNNRFQLAIGGKYFVNSFYESLGGGGANVAIGAAGHGLKVAVLAKVGNNPFKTIILKKLKERKVDTKLCRIEPDYFNISAILLTEKGERSIINYVSPHQHLITNKPLFNKLTTTKFCYFGNLPNVSLTDKITLLTLLKKNNIYTIVNLGVSDCRRPKSQLEEMLKRIDLLIVNGHEFSELVKAKYNDIFFDENVIEHYLPIMRDKLVIITEGKKGSFGYKHGKVFCQKALPVEKIIDTTGAGDGYTAAFIATFYKTNNILKAMEQGSKYAARILEKVGAN